MCILKLFKRRPESPAVPVAEQQPEPQVSPTEPKRDYRSEPGHYKPKCELVRLSNVAQAAGVSYKTAKEFADKMGMKQQRKSKLYISNKDAVLLHKTLCDLSQK